MKKSKFLQSSKDMLSRSFNPAKCKTSLKLAESRLKLLRNKKEVQVKQMKREIAQLLESGQDRTARIRIEHVIREEKMMAAYDLIEIYCELIVARMPIIESQKNCPIDLKEAIASVIFASPRCGDVPELLDARKHLTAKYGKEFTTAAIELRPACGVGRMLVEKLSATAPDGQTKIKILTAIANEHNIKWDPNSFEEKDSVPSNDLLNGPSTLTKESNVHDGPSSFKAPDVQAPANNHNMHIPPLNYSQQDPRNSSGAEKLAPGQTIGVSTTIQPKKGPPGDQRSQLFHGDVNSLSPDRHRWHMEFKDATSAAQAAAESAERASMAARAAAELSSGGRIMRQYSAESHKSDGNVLKDEGPEPYVASEWTDENISEEPVDRLRSGGTMFEKERIDHIRTSSPKTDGKLQDSYGGTKAYNVSASLKSKASTDHDLLDHTVPAMDGYSRNNSLKDDSRGEMSMNKQSFKYEAEGANNRAEKSENFREESTRKQSVNSSDSQPGVSDDINIFSSVVGEEAFLATGKGEVGGKASQKSSHESSSLYYDKYDSNSEDHGFDYGPKYDEQDLEFHLRRKVHEHISVNKESWYPGSSASKTVKSNTSLFFTTKNSSHDLSENLTATNGSELDNFMPVTFDDSDGPTFESDEDINMSRLPGTRNSSNLLSKHKESRQPGVSPYNEKENPGFDQKHFSPSFDDEFKYEEMNKEKNQRKNFDADSAENFSIGNPSVVHPDLGFEKSQVEPIDFDEEPPSPDRQEGLNFEKLTGGFRHKGHNHLPYMMNRFDGSSSSKEEKPKIIRSGSPTGAESPKKSTVLDQKRNTRRSKLNYDSDSDSSEEKEISQKKIGDTGKEIKTESRFGASNSIFDSDSDLEDDAWKQHTLSTKPHLRSGISRRTKASTSSPGANSYPEMQVRSGALDYGADIDGKPKSSYISETRTESDKSGQWENYDQSASMKVASKPAKSNFWGPPEQPNSAKTSDARMERKQTLSHSPETQQEDSSLRRNSSLPQQPKNENISSATMQESKISRKSSELEETSSFQPKKEASVGSGKPKAAIYDKSSSNKDGSTNKASHVHPKLPDYDNLLQSLRRNRS